jgi:hypothetical protein
MPKKNRLLLAIVLMGIALRVGVVIFRNPGFPPGWGGETASVASAIYAGRGFSDPYGVHTGPTAKTPPVYPVLLAGLYALFGEHTVSSGLAAMLLNVWLSAAVIPLIYMLGRELHDVTAGVIGAAMFALWPMTGYSEAVHVNNTSLYALSLTATFLVALRGSYWMAPLAGAAVLIDPSAIVPVGVLILWLLSNKESRLAALAAAAVFVFLAPWAARNAIVMGRPVLRSDLGLELNRGLEEHDYAVLGEPMRLPNRDASELQKYRSEGEMPYMAARMQQAWRGINSDRIGYAGIVARRFIAFWVGGPQLDYLYLPAWRWRGAKYCLYALPALLALGGIAALFRMSSAYARLFTGVLVFYPAIYYLTSTDPRYHDPLEPLLMTLSGVAVAAVVNRQFSAGLSY